MKKLVPKDAVLIPDSAECVFKGKIFDVYQWPQKMFDGSEHTFEMLKRPDTVTVIPIIVDKILTIEDEQPHSGTRLSFPGGRVDADEDSTLSAAKREVKEETGYDFANWKLVNVTQPHSKLEWFIYFYIAWDGRKTAKPQLDIGEKITLKELAFDDAKNFVITKSGYLGESMDVFEKADSLEGLINLPEFQGKEVNR
ncbi:NUDIX hydrolase [Candidatus Saccharibacteria bacterium]|nr:NUDIX hydrolase [Candidatus Saccharibacteria bacterium]